MFVCQSRVFDPSLINECELSVRHSNERQSRHGLNRFPKPSFFSPKLADTYLIRHAEQCKESHDAKCTEPVRLVICWRNREIQECASLVPYAAVVTGFHAEPVMTRGEVGVKRLPAITHLAPIAIHSFKLVEKTNLLRCHKTQCGVVNFQVSNKWRQSQRSSPI